jgi:hypothetical protein
MSSASLLYGFYTVFFESVAWGFHISTYFNAVEALVNARDVTRSRSMWHMTIATASLLLLIGSLDAIMQLVLQWEDLMAVVLQVETFGIPQTNVTVTIAAEITSVSSGLPQLLSLAQRSPAIRFLGPNPHWRCFLSECKQIRNIYNALTWRQIYRLYIFIRKDWPGGWWICMLPSIVWLGQAASGGLVMYVSIKEIIIGVDGLGPGIQHMGYIFLVSQSSCTLFITLFATSTSTSS